MAIFTRVGAGLREDARGPSRAAAPAEEKPEREPEEAAAPEQTTRGSMGLSSAALGWQAAAAGLGFVLGSGRIYGGAAPFGLAMAIGCAPGYALACMAGALAGSLVFLPPQFGIQMAGALAAVWIGRRAGGGKFWPGAAAGCGMLLLEQVVCGFSFGRDFGMNAAQNASVLCTAVLAGALGFAVRSWPVSRRRGAALWLMMLTAGLQSFALYGFAPGLALAAGMGLCAACAASLEESAALAVALAAALTAASPSLCCAALAVALGTLAAAVLCPGERLRCAGVFAAGCAVGALAAPNLADAISLLSGAGCGMVVFLLLPPGALQKLFPPPAPPAASQSLAGAARRLSTVADTLSDIADTVNAVCVRQAPPRGETYDYVVDFAARSVCQSCARREQCWIKGYSTAMDGLYALKPTLEADARVQVENLPGQLSVCVHPVELCAAVTRGWRLWRSRRQTRARAAALRGALTEQYGAMAGALAQLAAQLGRTGLPDPRRETRLEQLFASIGLDALECSVTTDAASRVCATVSVARTTFVPEELRALTGEVSRICHRDFALPDVINCRTVTMLTFGERPLFCPEFGTASRPAQEVSGDVSEHFCDAAGRAQLFLCDGMGTGRAAAVDGQLAARLTGQLLRAGFAAQSAARLVNVAMGLKNAEQESGATLDLLTVDLFTGRAGLFKAGAAPSFLVRGGVPRMMENASLPMGVTDSVVGRSTSFGLSVGDEVVLVSDGALSDGSDWLLQQLELCAKLGHTPAQTADVLADAALRRAHGHRDDITVAVLKLGRSSAPSSLTPRAAHRPEDKKRGESPAQWTT